MTRLRCFKNALISPRRQRGQPLLALPANMRGQRRAFTLMEMLLVLALIVIIAGVTVPVISTTLADARLTAAADIVYARLADTRARALDEGRPWRLACIPNTGTYMLAPENSPHWDDPALEPDEKEDLVRDELPTSVIFALDGNVIFNSKEAAPSTGSWATVGVYLPNGSARDDVTFYFGTPGISPMAVQLRAITGSATIQDSFNMKEQP